MLLYVVTNNYVSLMVPFLGYFQSTERVDGTKHVGFYYNANRAKLANPERAFSRSYLAPIELCLSYEKN